MYMSTPISQFIPPACGYILPQLKKLIDQASNLEYYCKKSFKKLLVKFTYIHNRASLVAQRVKNLPAMRET